MMNPFKNMNNTLILDADSLVFFACYNAEKDTLPEEFHIEQERHNEIVRLACEYAKNHVKELLDTTGCGSVECYFTTGRESFRYRVDSTYKANRKKAKDPLIGLIEVKEYLNTIYDGEICKDYEADDIVVWRGKKEDTLVCAIDKDVLYQLEGTHYNYKRNEYVNTTKEEAERFLWEQMIIGDATDGIFGVNGMGKVKAKKFLEEVEPEKYSKEVLKLYKSVGKSKKEFLDNLNLLDMHLMNAEGVIELRKDI